MKEIINKFEKDFGYKLTYTKDGDLFYDGNIVLTDRTDVWLPDNLTVKGSVFVYSSNLTVLPKGLVVLGCLDISRTKIEYLPHDLIVRDALNAEYTNITKLQASVKIGKSINFTGSSLKTLPDYLFVSGNLILRGCYIKELPKGLSVQGDLDLEDTEVTKIPCDINVEDKLLIHGTPIKTLPDGLVLNTLWVPKHLKRLPDDIIIYNGLICRETELEELPENYQAGDFLHISDCNIKKLPKNLDVRGCMYCDNFDELTCDSKPTVGTFIIDKNGNVDDSKYLKRQDNTFTEYKRNNRLYAYNVDLFCEIIDKDKPLFVSPHVNREQVFYGAESSHEFMVLSIITDEFIKTDKFKNITDNTELTINEALIYLNYLLDNNPDIAIRNFKTYYYDKPISNITVSEIKKLAKRY